MTQLIRELKVASLSAHLEVGVGGWGGAMKEENESKSRLRQDKIDEEK